MVNSLQNSCFYLTEEQYHILIIIERIVKSENLGSFGTPTDEEEHGKYVIVDVAKLDEIKDAECHDLFDNDPRDYASFLNCALFPKDHSANEVVEIHAFIEDTW